MRHSHPSHTQIGLTTSNVDTSFLTKLTHANIYRIFNYFNTEYCEVSLNISFSGTSYFKPAWENEFSHRDIEENEDFLLIVHIWALLQTPLRPLQH